MAYMEINSLGVHSAIIWIKGLEYTTDQYQFKLIWYRTGYYYERRTWVYYGDSNIYKETGTSLIDLIPNSNYTFEYYAEYPKNSGTWYLFEGAGSTLNITEPSASEYLPTYYPTIRNQLVYANGSYHGEAGTCVPNTLCCSLDIMEKRERNSNNNYYSAIWIFGNRYSDGSGENGMYINEAINKLKSDGTPKWNKLSGLDTVPDAFPDNRFYYDSGGLIGAKNLVANNYTDLIAQSKNQKVNSNVQNVSFYDCQTIANAIQANGFFVIGFYISNEFDYPLNGLISQPSSSYTRGSHAVALIGWKTANGKKYWIGQNSWGTTWGDSGRCYIPMDWGVGSTQVYDVVYRNWVFEGYEITNFIPPIPNTPNAPSLLTRINGGAKLQWDYVDYAESYNFRFKEVNGSYNIISTEKNIFTLLPFAYGYTYLVSVSSVSYKGESSYSGENQVTIAPKTPTISKSSSTLNSININITGMLGNWTYVAIWYRENGGEWQVQNITYPNTQVVLNNLTQGSTYEIKASSFITVNSIDIESRDDYGNIGYSNILNVQLSTRPTNFSWITNIAYGQSLYNQSGKILYPISAIEWSNLINKINEFRQYKGLSNYTFTTVTSEMDITRAIFNEVIYAMQGLSAYFNGYTLITPRVASDNILDSSIYLNLRNCLNSIN